MANGMRAAAIVLCAYSMVLVPFMVIWRTRRRRRWPTEIAFSVGIDLILFSRILLSVRLWGKPVSPELVLTLIGAALLATTSHHVLAVWRDPEKH